MADKILIVDDDADSRAYLRLVLESEGYGVSEAPDGLAALELLKGYVQPDLILLDVMMPGLTGHEVCRRIKANPALEWIPVLFLSSQNQAKDKITGLKAGAADYVTKPFDPGEILARVKGQLRILNLTRELKKANIELLEKQKLIDEDLQAAAAMQLSLLPGQLPDELGVEASWLFQPCGGIGGDIFNLVKLNENTLAFYLLDVSGHGIPSALVAFAVAQALQPQSGIILGRQPRNSPSTQPAVTPPARVMYRLDELFPMDRFNRFFTMFYLVLDTLTGEFNYSCAGHPPAVLTRADGTQTLLKKPGAMIGLGGLVPFGEGSERMLPGDTLTLYSDGITEYFNAKGELFGFDNLRELLRANASQPLGELPGLLARRLEKFGGKTQPSDDVSMLSFRLKSL